METANFLSFSRCCRSTSPPPPPRAYASLGNFKEATGGSDCLRCGQSGSSTVCPRNETLNAKDTGCRPTLNCQDKQETACAPSGPGSIVPADLLHPLLSSPPAKALLPLVRLLLAVFSSRCSSRSSACSVASTFFVLSALDLLTPVDATDADFKHLRLWMTDGYQSTRINLRTLKFFDGSNNAITTDCSSDTCAASSEYSGTETAANAFDGSDGSRFVTAGGSGTNQWLMISFVSVKPLPSTYQICPDTSGLNTALYRPKSFKLQGSNAASPSGDENHADWQILGTVQTDGMPCNNGGTCTAAASTCITLEASCPAGTTGSVGSCTLCSRPV